jgi:NAD(P)-dependent dehydrogenase (short-subunit alcohol dehydrogenase family)
MNSCRRYTITPSCRHRGDASVPTPGVLVTGGASGLGKTICDVFYGEGYNVVCVDIMPINKRDFPLGARRCAARGMRAWEGGGGGACGMHCVCMMRDVCACMIGTVHLRLEWLEAASSVHGRVHCV